MSKNSIVVKLRAMGVYLALDDEYGGYVDVDIYDVISCEIDEDKATFIYDIVIGQPLPKDMSREPHVRNVAEMSCLDSLEIRELRARGVEVIIQPGG